MKSQLADLVFGFFLWCFCFFVFSTWGPIGGFVLGLIFCFFSFGFADVVLPAPRGGAWTLICYSGRPRCSAGQFVQDVSDHRIFTKVLFYLDEGGELHLHWMTPALRNQTVSIVLDGYQLGNTAPDKCGTDECEGVLNFSAEDKKKIFAAKELNLLMPIGEKTENSLPIDLSDLELALMPLRK